ncbi:molybdate transport system ATP-binding protein [Duganella sp. 3397]|uniref:ATP-binding cassette domain-containing protein n=1 Tax=Duganella sp. 3397 TaxID=2817732 RepID=UPI0028580FAF|nr:molybdate transport system ATP-binding protein [Duganella sp. 3397]
MTMVINVDIRKTLRSGDRVFELEARFASASNRVVIYGPSGAGKSQLLKAVAGLMTPDHGRIDLAGRCLFDAGAGVDISPQQRRVAYLFQDYALFPHLNVRQNIAFGLQRGWRNPLAGVDVEAVRYWLAAFELDHVAQQLPHQLSGGQRQRVALARALAPQPGALLLDEPFAALDPGLRERMRAELDALQRRLAIPMILITHDPEDVRAFGEHVLRMDHGRLEEHAG